MIIDLLINLSLYSETDVLTKTFQTGNEKIVGLLRIRTDYGFENDLVKNGFAKDFHVPGNVGFSTDKGSSPYHVMNARGEFLFSLVYPAMAGMNYLIIIPLIMWTVSFLLVMLLTLELALSRGRKGKIMSGLILSITIFSAIYILVLLLRKPAVFFQIASSSVLIYPGVIYISVNWVTCSSVFEVPVLP